MALPDAAAAYDRQQRTIAASTLLLARRYWSRLGLGDFDQAWRTLGPQLLTVLMAGQQAAVSQALVYVPAVLDELNIDSTAVAEVSGRSFVGVASDGRPLDSLLYQTVVQTRTALGQGVSLADSLQSGGSLLDTIVTTQTADAGRAAESVAGVVRPAVTGYVRMLQLPSCDRCAVLAGKFYRWNTGFQRHPSCDCRHVVCDRSVAEDLRTDTLGAIKAGQVKGLSKSDLKAIVEDGADPGKVINAKRGMSTELIGGLKIKTTTEGTGRRRGRKVRPIRLRPEGIYAVADDRAHAIELLRQHGYLI